jgi:hypothetical protein
MITVMTAAVKASPVGVSTGDLVGFFGLLLALLLPLRNLGEDYRYAVRCASYHACDMNVRVCT